ncbi:MAG: hypothetical protein K0U79_18845 [Gammaproteobacteria bacterium]|nr:hypothetical protein [Gammaproteobacteria bacterium]
MQREIVESGVLEIVPSDFCKFFQSSRGITGTEATYRALLYSHFLQLGIPSDDMVAEYPATTGGMLDLAICNGSAVEHLFEIKGGAYGNRHALKDEIKEGILEKDLRKLEATGTASTKRWMVALDLSSIGSHLNPSRLEWLARECSKRSITLLYFDLDKEIEIAKVFHPRGQVDEIRIPPTDEQRGVGAEVLDSLGSDAFWQGIPGVRNGLHEQNSVLRAYGALLAQGLSTRSISLETYFQFAKGKGEEGNNRPDIAVFKPEIKGMFNLYRYGKYSDPLDPIKVHYLLALIEIKVAPNRSQVEEDIQKLSRWRDSVYKSCEKNGITYPDYSKYIFVGFCTSSEVASLAADRGKELGIDVYCTGSPRNHGRLERAENF